MTLAPLAPIDAVITWVDGSDPAHRDKRRARLALGAVPVHPNGINPHRWGSSDELTYCLTALANHAPWLRRIWIVTDAQMPDLSAIPPRILDRLAIIDHHVIFAGHEEVLPTFNSLSIESMLWRIPGLAECFLYFNDDVFLTAPLQPEDVFHRGNPVLRGKWVDYAGLAEDPSAMRDPALFNHFTQINAARMAGYGPARMWSSAHVVHPLRRSRMADLFAQNEAAFRANIAHPFRALAQFQPMALHNHTAIRDGRFATPATRDYQHMRASAVLDFGPEQMRACLRRALAGGTKFLCVNDFPELEALVPDTRKWIERAIGI